MSQRMTTPPKTAQEYRRQKGPVPLIAILLALGLIAAGVLYFLPVFTGGY